LVAAEKCLGKIVAGMGDAETLFAIAREGYAGVAERVQKAVVERERALWPAAIEAAVDVLREMEPAVATVMSREVRL
jgi:predicted anti-sigma-YlaC factor YlaD